MYVEWRTGLTNIIQLAGGGGVTTETSNLRIETAPTFQQVAYIGGSWGRQFYRPGQLVSLSFDSIKRFVTISDAGFYINYVNDQFSNQLGGQCFIANINSTYGSNQVESLTLTSATYTGLVTLSINGTFFPATIPKSFNASATPASNLIEIFYSLMLADPEIRKRVNLSYSGNTLFAERINRLDQDNTFRLTSNGANSRSTLSSGVTPVYDSGRYIYDCSVTCSLSQNGCLVNHNVAIAGRFTQP
jgi:hypothetical protein